MRMINKMMLLTILTSASAWASILTVNDLSISKDEVGDGIQYTMATTSEEAATGGTITTNGNYRIHTFTNSGTFEVSGGSLTCDVLIVAGGGGGGDWTAGGGGAGGLIYTNVSVSGENTVIVGVGGAGGGGREIGLNGSNSVFTSLTAYGGGGGGNYNHFSGVGLDGGSGGGAGGQDDQSGGSPASGGKATEGQGHNGGGALVNTAYYGGGGGGAGDVGAPATSSAGGAGGIGSSYDISGSAIYYAGGGGGGNGSGSLGGGGWGATGSAGAGTNGLGGGGGANRGDGGNGGNGGSGIVIIRYLTTMPATPTNLSASDGTYTNKVLITWSAASLATGYLIFRHTTNNSASADQIGTAIATTYDDTGAIAGTTYYYWVKSTNSSGVSGFSSYVTGSKAAVSSAISAPENVQASDGTYTNKVRVSWNTVSVATNYQVWRNTTNNSASASMLSATSDTAYDDTTATTPGLTLYYWVKARNDSGVSAFSQPDAGYCGTSGSSGIADLSLRGFLFQPAVLTNNAHPELVMLVPVNNGPDNLSSSGIGFDFFLSGNTVFGDGDDEWIGDYPITVSIDAGSFTSVIISDTGLNGITIPLTASGAYYVFAKVKHTSAILDPNMTNNTVMRSGAIIVGTGAGAKEPVAGDFDGDSIADPCVYQESTGNWYMKLSRGGYGLVQVTGFGGEGWKPMSGDYDGDGKSDLAVYQESTGSWRILLSSREYSELRTSLGGLGYTSVSGDFNGGGHSDLAVYREATGYWLVILMETEAPIYFKFGQDGYVPVTGDYTGDGVTDLALYHESTGSWFFKLGDLVYTITRFGGDGWKSVGGDYDGDGKEDLMLYQASIGNWMVRLSGSGYAVVTLEGFGGSDYAPVSGDYDGDGKADLVLYNSSTATWLLRLSSANYIQVSTTF